MRQKIKKLVVTFAATSRAMKMEKRAAAAALEGRLIPIPPTIQAGCGLAFCTRISLRSAVEELLLKEEIEPEGIYEVFL